MSQVFHYAFKGMALGGVASVVASDEAEARALLMAAHFDLEEVELEWRSDFNGAGVVHFWDGDY